MFLKFSVIQMSFQCTQFFQALSIVCPNSLLEKHSGCSVTSMTTVLLTTLLKGIKAHQWFLFSSDFLISLLNL